MTTEEQLRSELEKAYAVCAEMRLALEEAFECPLEHFHNYNSCSCPECIKRALSTDCGSALLDELKRLREDKARLDWLQSGRGRVVLLSDGWNAWCPGDKNKEHICRDIRQAIDEARGKP